MRPILLVTTDQRPPSGFHESPRVRPRRGEAYIQTPYLEAIWQAGGEPLLVPPGPEQGIEPLLSLASGVVLTGGHFDIHPSWYGHEVHGRLDRIDEARTAREILLARACLERQVPVLGICGGMQAMAVAAGGSLIQDLPAADRDHMAHEQQGDPAQPSHTVRLESPASDWLGARVEVNSTHHQAVEDPGSMVACGWAEDGVIEAIWHPEHPFAFGVQWHPELIGQTQVYQALIDAIGQS